MMPYAVFGLTQISKEQGVLAAEAAKMTHGIQFTLSKIAAVKDNMIEIEKTNALDAMEGVVSRGV